MAGFSVSFFLLIFYLRSPEVGGWCVCLVPHCKKTSFLESTWYPGTRQVRNLESTHRNQGWRRAPSAWPDHIVIPSVFWFWGLFKATSLSEPQMGSVTRLGQDKRILLCLQHCPHSSNEHSSSRLKITEKKNWHFTYLFPLYLQLSLRDREKKIATLHSLKSIIYDLALVLHILKENIKIWLASIWPYIIILFWMLGTDYYKYIGLFCISFIKMLIPSKNEYIRQISACGRLQIILVKFFAPPSIEKWNLISLPLNLR